MSKFNQFKSCLKSPKNRFQLSAGLNLEKLRWNQQNLSRCLNLNRGLNSLNLASTLSYNLGYKRNFLVSNRI